MNDSDTKNEEVKTAVGEAVSQGDQVRDDVRRIVLTALETGEAGANRLLELTQDAMKSAIDSLGSLDAEEQRKRLEDTLAGLGDAYSSALHSASLSFEEARTKGTKFATEDLKGIADDFIALEKLFVETVSNLLKKSSGAVAETAENLTSHTKRVAEDFRPALSSLLESLKTHPVEFAEGAAALAANILTGALRGASEALKQSSDKDKN